MIFYSAHLNCWSSCADPAKKKTGATLLTQKGNFYRFIFQYPFILCLIPKPSEKSALGLGQSSYNRQSQIGSYRINTDQFAKPSVVDSRELSLKPKNRFFRWFGYVWMSCFRIYRTCFKNRVLPSSVSLWIWARLHRTTYLSCAASAPTSSGLNSGCLLVIFPIFESRSVYEIVFLFLRSSQCLET